MALDGADGDGELAAALDADLAPRLAARGLDPDVYGPYLRPVLRGSDDDEIEDLEEEWGTVLGLLQASSETHAEDDATWQELRREAEEAYARLSEAVRRERKEAREAQRQAREAQDRERERRPSPPPPCAARPGPGDRRGCEDAAAAPDDAAKRALLARFAYEDSDDEAEDGATEDDHRPGFVPTAASATRNRNTATSGPEESTAARPSGSNKQLERQKTKQAKEAKVAAKEERRKRAVKGERRR